MYTLAAVFPFNSGSGRTRILKIELLQGFSFSSPKSRHLTQPSDTFSTKKLNNSPLKNRGRNFLVSYHRSVQQKSI